MAKNFRTRTAALRYGRTHLFAVLCYAKMYIWEYVRECEKLGRIQAGKFI